MESTINPVKKHARNTCAGTRATRGIVPWRRASTTPTAAYVASSIRIALSTAAASACDGSRVRNL